MSIHMNHLPSSVGIGADLLVCEIRKTGVSSRGIWSRENYPSGFSLPVLMIQLTLYFILNHSIRFLLRPLKQSKFVSSALGGIILGPSVLGRNMLFRRMVFPASEVGVLSMMASLGSIYFIFLITMKMDIGLVTKPGKKAIYIGITSVLFSYLVTIVAIELLNKYLDKYSLLSLYSLSASLSVTSFSVLAYALDELNLLTSELGQIAMFSAMTNQVFGYLCYITSTVIILNNTKSTIVIIMSLSLLVAFIVLVIRPTLLWIIKRTPEGKQVAEIYIISILVLVLAVAGVCDIIGVGCIYGPMVLGLCIPQGSPLGAILVERIELLVLDFLLPFFFILMGLCTDVFLIQDWKSFMALESILLVAYMGKFLGTLLSSLYYCRISFRHAISISLIMDFKGIVEIIMYTYWGAHKFLDNQAYVGLVLSTVALTAILTPLTTSIYKPSRSIVGSLNDPQRTIQNSPHNTELRILSCIHNDDDVHAMITVLEASNPTEESPIDTYVLHLVELLGGANPLLLTHTKYRNNSSSRFTIGSEHIVTAFNNFSCNVDGRVSIHPFTMVAPYKNMHEGICKLAHDKLIPLIIIPYSMNQRFHSVRSNPLSNLNAKILDNATCSVGILVDRGLPLSMNCNNFSYNVAAIFLGGKDDREVLAYVTRMCGHPGVKVTVLRFLLDGDDHEGNKDDEERELDGASLDDFKYNTIFNDRAVFREVGVKDGLQAMSAIGSLENDYDLVMVGRRRKKNTLLRQGETNWNIGFRNVELGMIGDVLMSSDDFSGKTFSVLVIQVP